MRKFLTTLAAILAGLAGALTLQAQTQVVTGTVRDAAGEPIIGAFVMIQGTTTGASTDIDGKYVITVPDAKTAVLEFSLIGMATVTEAVSGRFSRIRKILCFMRRSWIR